jgi:hypothetical protein
MLQTINIIWAGYFYCKSAESAPKISCRIDNVIDFHISTAPYVMIIEQVNEKFNGKV